MMKKLTKKNHTSKHSPRTTQKGITLVALVITIIVLLILAGVAINMAINSDGLFGKANEAAEKWNESVAKEETAMGDLFTELDKVSPMEVELSTDIPEDWDSTKVSAVAKTGSRQAPIPIGFTVSSIEGENTIGGGLVIYEGTDAVTDEDTDNDGFIDAQEERNQFVWIPVEDINYMVMCKLNNANDDGTVCKLVLDNGTLRCMTHNAEGENTTELCGRVYETIESSMTVDENIVYTCSMTFDSSARAIQKWNTLWFHEPSLVSDYDNDTNTGYLTIAGVNSANELETQLIDDFEAMAKSVAQYGGFYIGRYEAGNNGESKRNQKVLLAGTSSEGLGVNIDTQIDGNMWYGMYKTLRDSTGVDKTALSSHMIWRKSV